MKKFVFFILFFALINYSYAEKEKITICFIEDGQTDFFNNEIQKETQKEIKDLLSRDYNIVFKTLTGQWTRESIKALIEQSFEDESIDFVIPTGAVGSDIICKMGPLPKPSIAPFIIYQEDQNLPRKEGTSGVKNLNYIISTSHFRRDIQRFLEIDNFSYLAVLISKPYAEEINNIAAAADSEYKIGENITGKNIIIGKSAKEALEKIPPEADAVYVSPLLYLPDSELDVLINGLIDKKLPSYSMLGSMEVERGVLAGSGGMESYEILTRRIAVNIQRILDGENPSELPLTISSRNKIIINMKTAKEIGVWPTWDILADAVILNQEDIRPKTDIEFFSTLKKAADVNLELKMKGKDIEQAVQEAKSAWSNLLPQLHLNGLYTQIEKEQAENSMGMQSEKTLSGDITLTQVIFSEPAWAYTSITKELKNSAQYTYEQVKLDIIKTAAEAYINILRAENYLRIMENNLDVSRTNLELARIRESIGFSGPEEVYRWEAEIASNQIDVVNARAIFFKSKQNLNLILNEPLKNDFNAAPINFDSENMINIESLKPYFNNPWVFLVLQDFLVEHAFKYSPELKALDSAIKAKERSLKSNKNSLWSPAIGLQGSVNHTFDRSGAGSEGFSIPGMPSGSDDGADDTYWTLGINISLPIFEGGSRFSKIAKTHSELLELQIQKNHIKNQIEMRTRAAYADANASYNGIKLSEKAADAAGKSYELVKDSYSKGMTSMLTLLDIQNKKTAADLAASNAHYDFISDLLAVERAVGVYYFAAPEESHQKFFENLEKFFEKARDN